MKVRCKEHSEDEGTMTKWTWVCPHCKYLNIWYWDIYDIPLPGDPPILLYCDQCGKKSKMQAEMVGAG